MEYLNNSLLIEIINDEVENYKKIEVDEFEDYVSWPFLVRKIHWDSKMKNKFCIYTTNFFAEISKNKIIRNGKIIIDKEEPEAKIQILDIFEYIIDNSLNTHFSDFSKIMVYVDKSEVISLPVDFLEFLSLSIENNLKIKKLGIIYMNTIKKIVSDFLLRSIDFSKEVEIFFIHSYSGDHNPDKTRI